eukprot:9395020-Pyramimonas_sp.AAC.1
MLGPQGKGLGPRGESLALTSFCRGVWTRARARSCGYQSDGLCPLCGQPDGVRHRLWQCMRPAAAEARAEAMGGMPV